MATSPVKDVPFGEALKISLNNYYDLLKLQLGTLTSEEYLQLRLAADAVDISEERYRWFSYYNLLRRSDTSIAPAPVAGAIVAASSDLASSYERFLRQLRSYVVKAALSPADQLRLAELDLELERLRTQNQQFVIADRTNWREFAEIMGYSVGDTTAYLQWSVYNGHLRDIEKNLVRLRDAEFDKRTILDRQYPEPTDREIIDAEFDFYNPAMRLRYPIHPDFEYPDGSRFSVTYLGALPLGSGALFDDRRVVSWDKTLPFLLTNTAGSLAAEFNRTTSESKSIETDWGHSGNVGFRFISVNANASEHQTIVEDFKRATTIRLSAAATLKVRINYPKWFQPQLFDHPRVKANLHDFEPFFGEQGTLLYHPTHLVLVRGFKVEFISTQNWTFDYRRKFSASAGGGFNVFGINFGGSNSYTNDTKEHKVDQSTTKLTLEDDVKTLRFVGYTVKRTPVMSSGLARLAETTLTREVVESLDTPARASEEPVLAGATPAGPGRAR